MTNRPDSTRVNIYGREYSIRGEGDPAYVAEIAHFVDMRMREMTDNVTMASTSKVAILAALNITDEMFRLEKSQGELQENHDRFLNALAEKIENALVRKEEHRAAASEPSLTGEKAVQTSGTGNASRNG